MPAPEGNEKAPNVSHATFVVFTGPSRLRGIIDDYGYMFPAIIGDNTIHSMILDPRFDLTSLTNYIVELGGTVYVPETPSS